ncbi:MAG: type IV pilin protein [Oceanobacter sp.]
MSFATTQKPAEKTTQSGFSLVELMIAVTIIGILSAIAIPSYQSYIRRALRADAIDEIARILDAQERYYGDHVTYTADLSKLGLTVSSGSGLYLIAKQDGLTVYEVSAAACSSTTITQCVEITADAVGTQAPDGDLVANSYGVETRTLPDGSVLDW